MNWLFVLINLFGSFLNVKKRVSGFLCWAICDMYFMLYSLYREEYSQVVLFFIYFLFAVYGIYQWQPLKSQE